MRARVRKDASTATVAPAPWTVRVAATMPKGVRVANPLLDEDVQGAVAVVDTGMSEDPLDLAALIDGADGALIVWDELPTEDTVEQLHVQLFKLSACSLVFGATYRVPASPQIELVAPAPSDSLTLSRVVYKNDQGALGPVEERYILGVVLEPDTVDSQGDMISAAEIRQAAHKYMQNFGNVGLQHQVYVNDKIKILESYVAPVEFTIGEQVVKAGTWLMGFRVIDDSIWAAVKAGVLGGLSIGGKAFRRDPATTA